MEIVGKIIVCHLEFFKWQQVYFRIKVAVSSYYGEIKVVLIRDPPLK